jgi:hypothetical protein
MTQEELREKLFEIIEYVGASNENALTDWEYNFVNDMHGWDGDFTDRQAACIEKIWNKYCQ